MLNLGLVVRNQFMLEIFSTCFSSSSKINCQCVKKSVDSFLRAYRKQMKLDLVILDYASINNNSLESIILIKRLIPAVKVVVLIVEPEEDFMFRVFHEGTDRYFYKWR